MMRLWIRKIVVIVMLFLIIFTFACKKDEEKNFSEVVNLDEENKTVEAFGIVKAENIKNIIVDFPANVEKIHVKEGQRVKKDDTLVTLNIIPYFTQIINGAHKIKILELEKETIENNILKDQNNDPEILKLLNDLKHAEETLNQSKVDYETKEKLFEAGSISKKELENARKELQALEKNLEDARYALEIKNNSKKDDIIMLQIKDQEIRVLENDLRNLEDKLSKSFISDNRIISDLENGVVYDIGYIQGDMVRADKKLLSIMDLNSTIIEAEISEEFIKDVKLGADVSIVPLIDKSIKYKGTVVNIANKAINKSGETIVLVEIAIEEKDNILLPYFNVDVTISVESNEE